MSYYAYNAILWFNSAIQQAKVERLGSGYLWLQIIFATGALALAFRILFYIQLRRCDSVKGPVTVCPSAGPSVSIRQSVDQSLWRSFRRSVNRSVSRFSPTLRLHETHFSVSTIGEIPLVCSFFDITVELFHQRFTFLIFSFFACIAVRHLVFLQYSHFLARNFSIFHLSFHWRG